MARKKIRIADEKLTGEEPSFSGELSRYELAIAFNWYNYYGNLKKNIVWVLGWMKDNGYSDSQIRKVELSTSSLKNQNFVSTARIVSRGGTNDELINKLKSTIKHILNNKKKNQKGIVKPRKIAPEIPNPLMADIDEILDIFYASSYRKIQDFTDVLKDRPNAQMIGALSYVQELLDEVTLHREDLTSRQKKRYINQLTVLKTALDVAKVNKVRRKRVLKPKKVQPKSVIVSKLRFLSNSAQYNMSSINPEKILDSSVLYVFRTDYRLLIKFVALPNKQLSIHRSSIDGYDETKSFMMKLRHPEQVLPDVLKMPKRTLEKRFELLTTKRFPANKRLNDTTILMRVIK